MLSQFTDRELGTTKDKKEFVWENETRFARLNLVNDGRMKRSRVQGLWEISHAGREWLSRYPSPPRLNEREPFDEEDISV